MTSIKGTRQRIIFIILLGLAFMSPLHAQTVKGSVVDAEGIPVSAVAIILQDADSTFIGATLSAEDGSFSFASAPVPYRLIFQHLAYRPLTLQNRTDSLGTIVLEDDKDYLEEAVVTAIAPTMTVSEDGALSFHAHTLLEGSPATNAWDLMKEVPFLQDNGGEYSIVGTSKTTIVLDGKKTSMSPEQLKNLLLSTAAERVRDIEIHYKSPSSFGIRGASINIVMKKERTSETRFNGLFGISETQKHYDSQSANANFSMSRNKLSWDFSYQFNRSRDRLGLKLWSNHSVGDALYHIRQTTIQKQRSLDHTLYTSLNADLGKDSNVDVSYSASFSMPSNNASGHTGIDGSWQSSSNSITGDKVLHDLAIESTIKSVGIGMELLYYRQKSSQHLDDNGIRSLASQSGQHDYSFRSHIQKKLKLKRDMLSFSIGSTVSRSDNSYKGTWNKSAEDDTFHSIQREHTLSASADWTRPIAGKGRLTVTLAGEYFNASTDDGDTRATLWKDFHLYPSLLFQHPSGRNNMFQVTLNSDRSFPAYWKTTASRVYINSYCLTEGNPRLKPYGTYQLNVNYVIHRRYVLGIFSEYSPGYSAQMLYQDQENLFARYRYYNMGNSSKFGGMSILPVKWTNSLESRFTANLFYMAQSGVFEAMRYDRGIVTGRISCVNSLSFNREKTLVLQISGWYQLPAIQGIYTVKAMSSVSSSLTWNPKKLNLSVILQGNDIFHTYRMKVETDFMSQHYGFNNDIDSRGITLTLRYSFNGYQDKSVRTVDKARLGL